MDFRELALDTPGGQQDRHRDQDRRIELLGAVRGFGRPVPDVVSARDDRLEKKPPIHTFTAVEALRAGLNAISRRMIAPRNSLASDIPRTTARILLLGTSLLPCSSAVAVTCRGVS